MVRIPTSKVRDEFSETVNRVLYQSERVVLQRHGKDIAAIVPIADLTALQRLAARGSMGEAGGAEGSAGAVDRQRCRTQARSTHP